MNSASLEKRGVGSWAAFAFSREREVLAGLPTSPGVYVMLLNGTEPRLRGASDIAYIGKATNRNGLCGRVRQYFHPGPTQSTNLAMKERLVAENCSLRLGFIVLDSPAVAARLESELLTEFEQEHGELPPYNRQRALGRVPFAFSRATAGLREPQEDVAMHGTFRIIGFDEGGVRGSSDNQRLVCVLADGGKLAIWGREGATDNIDNVVRAGLPCIVECEYRLPNEIQSSKYGHTHWVRQDFDLRVVT